MVVVVVVEVVVVVVGIVILSRRPSRHPSVRCHFAVLCQLAV